MSLVDEQVKAAIGALYSFLDKRAAVSDSSNGDSKSSLFDDEFDVSLTIALKKTPEKNKNKPYLVPIAHSLYDRDGVEICLFTKDPQEEYRKKLEEQPVRRVTKVISITKLKKNYHQYSDRRQLLSMYDLFMCDDRILPILPAAIGKKFFEKKKQPIPVNISKNGGKWDTVISQARDSTAVFINGPCLQVKIGRSTFSKTQIYENIMGSIDGIVDRIPQKWKNVQAIFIKTHDSVALPLYNSLPTTSLLPSAESQAAVDEAKAAKSSKKGAMKGSGKKKSILSRPNTIAKAMEEKKTSAAAASGKGSSKGSTKGSKKGTSRRQAVAAAAAKSSAASSSTPTPVAVGNGKKRAAPAAASSSSTKGTAKGTTRMKGSAANGKKKARITA